jgi:hypothetical protein
VSVRPDRDAVFVSRLVQSVAAACGASTVMADDALAGSPGGATAVRVVTPAAAAEGAERVDLVVSFDAPAHGAGWEAYFAALARRAEKSLLVVVRNAERPGQGTAPDTSAIARVLWQVGRVRQHVYLGVPRFFASADVVPVPAGLLVRRTARLHAFVVDTAPRTPQARRRLRTVATGPAGA